MAINLALAGNPNSGKTTLFNQLTGSRAHVGNWPGVTVERREGTYKKDGVQVNVIDLPGIYSLSPYSPEEVITRNYLISDSPDVVVNIVDATNLERNLYLTTQILETKVPVVVALNMMDVLNKEKAEVNIDALSKKLGVPVIGISAAKNTNTSELIEACIQATKTERQAKSVLEGTKYGDKVIEIGELLKANEIKNSLYFAVKLAEKDEVIHDEAKLEPVLNQKVDILLAELSEIAGNDTEAVSADLRYRYITSNLSPLIKKVQIQKKLSTSDKIDRVLTSRIFGFPIFLLIMFLMFHFTFTENFLGLGILGPGKFLEDKTVILMDWLTGLIAGGLTSIGASAAAMSLVVDGILAGVGAVMGFLPLVLVLYLCISILEDSGYMARAAFIMDRLMRGFGLSGKSFVPMIMGFGCSVPAIAATRTIENENDRKLTIMLIPFMSCGAKVPIYGLIIPIFFERHTDLITFGFYLLGMVVAIIAGLILKKTVYKGDTTPFIMELPDYRLPSLKSLGITLWEKFKGFATKVGTVITVATIVIWFLANFGFEGGFGMTEANSAASILGYIGNALKFIFLPLGFASGADGWKAVVAVLTGLVAKEAVISTMGQLYNPGISGDAIEDGSLASTALMASIAATFSIPAALSFITWNLLSTPCMAAVAAIKAEMPSKKSFWGTMAFHLGVSWAMSFIVFQGSTIILNLMNIPLYIM